MGFSFPRPRQLWRQVHWFIGITAGTLLMLIGLSGAALSFREELLDAINPGARHVAVRDQQPPLTPPALLAAIHREWPGRGVGTLAVFNEPGTAARVIFEPQAQQRRGETIYLDPYTAKALPPLKGAAFFETAESLHRWLLLPRAQGRIATGILALCLLALALSGLYVRWPRQWTRWRVWFAIASHLKGRALLSRWHVVLGTVALPVYLVFTLTGVYWAFDTVRGPVDQWLGVAAKAPKADKPRMDSAGDASANADITVAWLRFEQLAKDGAGWSQAILRITGGVSKQTLQLTWLDAHPAHERARNRMRLALADGGTLQDDRFAHKTSSQRIADLIYPLHMGTYFGLPGRIVMMLASLALAVFGITGWWLYLDLRRKRSRLTN